MSLIKLYVSSKPYDILNNSYQKMMCEIVGEIRRQEGVSFCEVTHVPKRILSVSFLKTINAAMEEPNVFQDNRKIKSLLICMFNTNLLEAMNLAFPEFVKKFGEFNNLPGIKDVYSLL